MNKIKVLKMVKLCNYYFYKYLTTADKRYIDKFFNHTKKLKKEIEKLD